MPEFMPGLELCRLFYHELVGPILQDAMPGLRYSAARAVCRLAYVTIHQKRAFP